AACALAGIPAPVLDHRILPASSLLDWVRGVAVEVYHEPVPGDVVFVERASGAAGIGIVGRQSAVSGRPIAAFIILADGRVAYCHHFGIRWCERTQAVRALRLEKFLGMRHSQWRFQDPSPSQARAEQQLRLTAPQEATYG